MKKIFLLGFFLFFFLFSNSQSIMNVETMRLVFDTTDHWAGSIELSGLYQAEKVDREKILIESSAHAGFRWKRNIVLFLGNVLFERVGKTDIENKYNIHLRYNYQIHKRWHLEVFGQLQHNHQIELTKRDLTGLGVRFSALDKKWLKLNLGTVVMYEHQVISDSIYYNYYDRSSTYLFMGFSITPDMHILSTTYYQPLFSDFSNFRVSSELSYDVSISKIFSIVLSYTMYYDTEIRKDVPDISIPTDTFKTSLKFKF